MPSHALLCVYSPYLAIPLSPGCKNHKVLTELLDILVGLPFLLCLMLPHEDLTVFGRLMQLNELYVN